MTPLFALSIGPLIAVALGLGTVPLPGPPPIITVPPRIQLSLVGGGVQAGQHLQVQALVTGVGGIREQGTVTFWIAGTSTKVGSTLDATSTATANLGFVTTAPATVDASFVFTGSSVEAASAEATFRASPIEVTPFVGVDPAVAGSPVAVHFALNLGPTGYAPSGHVDVMIGIASVRSGFCVLAPGGSGSVVGLWKCTAMVPSLPAGNVELHIVLADSPYYSASTYLFIPVATAPVAAAPKPSSAKPATPTAPAITAPSAAPTTATGTGTGTSASPAPELVAADGNHATTPPATADTSWVWLVLLAVALAALIGAALLVLRRMRLHG
ncbi:MAG: hypothetical protein ABJA11_00375 [Pseudolysinimonas sp.]